MSKSQATKKTANGEALNGAPNASGLVEGHGELARRRSLDDWTKARRALLRSCKRRDAAGLKRLDQVADKLVDMAIAGNMQAAVFVFERLDGKGTQTVDIKQDITVSSIGEAHLHALQRLTDAVTRHDEAKTVDVEATEVDTK